MDQQKFTFLEFGWRFVVLVSAALVGISLLQSLFVSPELHVQFGKTTNVGSLVQEFCNNAAIGVLVTKFIGVSIERASTNRMLTFQDQTLGQINKSVEKAIFNVAEYYFGQDKDPDLVNASIQQIFKHNLLRENMSMVYTLLDYEHSDKFVVLRWRFEFIMFNSSKETVPFSPTISLPILFGEDAPLTASAETKLLSYSVDGDSIDPSSIELSHKSAAEIRFKFPTIAISAGGRSKFSVSAQSLKRLQENEIFRSHYPAKGVTVEIHNCSKVQYSNIQLSPIHWDTPKYEEVPKGGFKSWSIETVLLPYNGWVLFWN